MKRLILSSIFFLAAAIVFAENQAVLCEVLKPDKLIVDGDRIYITSKEMAIYVYSIGGFKFIKQFVKQGEGPGEASLSIDLKPHPALLIVEDYPKKIMYYSRDGDYIKEKRIAGNVSDISFLNKNFLGVIKYLDDKREVEYFSINFLNDEFNIIKELRKGTELEIFTSKKANKKKILRPCAGHIVYRIYNDRIYIADTNRGFFITVFDSAGNQLYAIEKKYKKIKVPASYIENIMNKLKKTPIWDRIKTRYRYIFPKYFTAFKDYWVNNEKIYALTYETKEGKQKTPAQRELVVLDLKGNTLKRMFVPDSDLCSIYNDKYYYLIENEEKETWELHVENIK